MSAHLFCFSLKADISIDFCCTLIFCHQFGTKTFCYSSPFSAAYMHQWIWSAFVQIMACRLFDAKPLAKPMLGYCQLDPMKETSVKFLSKYKSFHLQRCIWKYCLWNGGHFVQGEMSTSEESSSVNSLGPSDTIWCWRAWSTLVQVMACCLMAPSHYLNQCWLIISKVLWYSSEDIIIRRFEDTNQYSKIEDYILKITLRSPRGHWDKHQMIH